MTFPTDPTQRAYAQAVGTTRTGNLHIDTRDPTVNDVYSTFNFNYPIGYQWENTADESLWFLNNYFQSGNGTLQANWIRITSGAGNLESLTPDIGGAVFPVANNINVFSSLNNTFNNSNNGIQTVHSSNPGELDIILTNRAEAQLTTTDDNPHTILGFSLSLVAGVYNFFGTITAFDITDTAGAAYDLSIGVRSDGGTATLIATSVTSNFAEVAMANATISVNTFGNSFLIQVTGLTGKTIDWDLLLTYRFVS